MSGLSASSWLRAFVPAACWVLAAGLHPAAAIAPGEVEGLFFSDSATLTWQVEPQAATYNVYRGYLADLSATFYGTTFAGDLPDPTLNDPTVPPAGWGFFYLVTAANADGEGTLGYRREAGGATRERENGYPWPGRAVAGRWDGLSEWPGVAIHAVLLHTGGVLFWAGGKPTPTWVWDPVTENFDASSNPTDLFCAGHTALADGRIFVAGGTTTGFGGGRWASTFDPVTQEWQRIPRDMIKGRWYPTTITEADGRVLVFSGNDADEVLNPYVERFLPGGSPWWEVLNPIRFVQLYPRMHLMPDGQVLHVGPEPDTYLFDPVSESWNFVTTSAYDSRGNGTSVLLPPGYEQVLIVGGARSEDEAATATAEILDLSAPAPTWRSTAPTHFGRVHANVVILPDGTVLLAGGGRDWEITTYASEIYDPAAETWTVVASQKSFRLYHSTALLLPDGRVVWAGSTTGCPVPGEGQCENATSEIYSPGYLFRGPRPEIAAAPQAVGYGETFTIDTPDADRVMKVVFIRPGSVTHSVNMEQRYIPLTFSGSGTSLQATAPSNANIAAPGFYMLFLVDGDGVPSKAPFVQLR